MPNKNSSRTELIARIARHVSVRGGHEYEARTGDSSWSRGPWLFCFDVKIRGRIDLGFDKLLALAVAHGILTKEHMTDPFWVTEASSIHEGTNMEDLFDAALQFCAQRYTGKNGPDMALSEIRSGHNLDIRITQCGRSGGWMVLTSIDGVALTTENDFRNTSEWPVSKLKRLANLLDQLSEEFSPAHVKQLLMEECAGLFFLNRCRHLALTKDDTGKGI